MIKSRKDLHFYLKEDGVRNGINTEGIKNYFKYLVCLIIGYENACAFRYIKCMRYFEYHSNSKHNIIHNALALFYKIKLFRLGRKYNISIQPNTCGFGLRIMHLSGGGGILLNVKKIGNYCGFNSGVLIGNKDGQENRPIIGNHVAFGPGAKAFGNIIIGDSVFVAPNAVVTKDIQDNCIVGGIPARIIKNNKNE